MKFESEDEARQDAVRKISKLLSLSPIDVRRRAAEYFSVEGNPETGYRWNFKLKKPLFSEL